MQLLKMEDIPQHCVYLPHTVRIAVCIVVLQHVTRQTYRVGQPRGAARCLPTAAACTCSRPTWPVALLPNRMRFVRSQWKEQRATYGVDKHQPSTSQQRQAHCCTRGWNASGDMAPSVGYPHSLAWRSLAKPTCSPESQAAGRLAAALAV